MKPSEAGVAEEKAVVASDSHPLGLEAAEGDLEVRREQSSPQLGRMGQPMWFVGETWKRFQQVPKGQRFRVQRQRYRH